MKIELRPQTPVTLSVVVPVYRSHRTLPELVSRLEKILPKIASAYEIILVDDGSPEPTPRTCRELAQDFANVRPLFLTKNFGQHSALLAGIRAARYEFTVTLDDDLQNPPEEIPQLLENIRKGFDLVYGCPDSAEHAWWRNLTSRATKRVMAVVLKMPHIGKISSFRVFRTDLRRAFENYHGCAVNLDVLLSWGTNSIGDKTVEHFKRTDGKSHYTFLKLLKHALNMALGFSTVPLRVASIMGFLCTLLGSGLLIYILGSYFIRGSTVAGFPFVASVVVIFSGVQLFCLGIFGEYLASVHQRSQDRPSYLIRETSVAEVSPVRERLRHAHS